MIYLSKTYSIWLLVILASYLHAGHIAPGVYYEHTLLSSPYALSIHTLTVNPEQASIILEASHNQCISAEKTSHMAQRKRAIAAINGGFFDFGQRNKLSDLMIKFFDMLGFSNYNAFPVFALKINNAWFSLSIPITGAIGWKNGGQVAHIDQVKTAYSLVIQSQQYPIADINKPYAAGPILYTSVYGTRTPKKKDFIELIIEHNTITRICTGGNSIIPDHGYIYAYKKAKSGDYTSLMHAHVALVQAFAGSRTFSQWGQMEYILGSTPLLIHNNTIIPEIFTAHSSFYTKREPRTAIGLLATGEWLFLVVDGRQKFSVGMSLAELARYMHTLGCHAALNLDGGGSSTMVINNTIVNSPSGREYSLWRGKNAERPVASALLVMPKQ